MLNKRGMNVGGKLIWLLVILFVIALAEKGWFFGFIYGNEYVQIIESLFFLVVGLIYLFSRGRGFGAGRAFSVIFGVLCLILALFGAIGLFSFLVMEIPFLGPFILNSFFMNAFGLGSWWRLLFILIILLYFFFGAERERVN